MTEEPNSYKNAIPKAYSAAVKRWNCVERQYIEQ